VLVGGDEDDDELRLRPVAVHPIGWRVESAGRDEDSRSVVRRVFDQACCPFATPSHALCLVEPEGGDERPVVVIGLD
ncbi:hypothetical protein KC216_22630, partial [Mycobacterium tuberculosis]|nr:hypothetical protein [Mycobacterium tuberculosis]